MWLQGDNTRNSNDSRVYGAVPCALLRGRVVARVWPLDTAGWTPSDASLGSVQLLEDGAAARLAAEKEALQHATLTARPG